MTSLRTVTAPVTRTQIVRFAGAAGDFNPMHHDEPFAREAGQPGVFAMGQLQAAVLGQAVADWVGADALLAYGVRFRDKVWPGDELVLSGVMGEAQDGEHRCELEARRRSDDTLVLSGWARVRADAVTPPSS